MLVFIYKISNIINNKVYIGQTIRPVKQRFQRHISEAMSYTTDTHLARAIRKHGKDNFILEIIDEADSQDELNLKEQYWIRYYNSTNSKCGYNETDALYKCGGNTYKSKTEKELEIIKNKIRESKIGTKNPNATAVKCFNVKTGQELFFDTVKECRIYFKETHHRFITTRTTGKIKGLYKNEWKIAYADEDYSEFYPARSKMGTQLKVLDLKTNELTQFNSIRSTSRQIGISKNTIRKHIKNNENNFIIDNYKITILN